MCNTAELADEVSEIQREGCYHGYIITTNLIAQDFGPVLHRQYMRVRQHDRMTNLVYTRRPVDMAVGTKKAIATPRIWPLRSSVPICR